MAKYDDSVRKRIQLRWNQYKDEVKTNQTQAAKSMGMNQSALGQYLRGDIPLNADFIKKFAALTDTDFDDLNIRVSRDVGSVNLQVKFTLSGRHFGNKRRMIKTVVPSSKCYLVEVDYRSHYLPKGSCIVVSEDSVCHEGDSVIMVCGQEQVVYGILENTEDGWMVIEQHFFGARSYLVGKNDVVHRVVSIYFPDGSGTALT